MSVRRLASGLLCALGLLSSAPPARADDPPADAAAPAPADAEAERQRIAKSHFERGVDLLQKGAFDGALLEFERSRQAVPTRPATENSGVCLRELGRLDEAEAMFQSVLQDFGAVPPEVEERIKRQRREIVALLGEVDVQSSDAGASVSVDGRPKGKLPLAHPLRLTAGAHRVTLRLEGYETFEQTVDVVAGQRVVLKPTLGVMGQVGRLRVREKAGRSATVIVDGVEVGTTPWEGALAPGDHAVWLVGPWSDGALPVTATVLLGQRSDSVLTLRELESALSIAAVPRTATIAIGDVTVGRGAWEGRLLSGPVEITVSAPGYGIKREQLTLAALERRELTVELASVAPGEGAGAGHPLEIFARGGALVSPQMVAFECEAPCEDAPALGLQVGAGALYRASGFGIGAVASYVGIGEEVTGRPTRVTPIGRSARDGRLADVLALRAADVAAVASYRYGRTPFFAVEAAVGAFVGELFDARSLDATDSAERGYAVGPYGTAALSAGISLRPSARLGFTMGADQMEAWIEVGGLFLIPLAAPEWAYDALVPVGADGAARLDAERVLGPTLAVTPALGFTFAP